MKKAGICIGWFVFFWSSVTGSALAAESRVQKCEEGIRSYLAYEKKGWKRVESAAPGGAHSCRSAVGDVEQTTVMLVPECGNYVFEAFQSPEKKNLSRIRGVVPSDTVLDVITKARIQYLAAIKSFCGMEPPPAGISQDAADCAWYINVQLKYMKKLADKMVGFGPDARKQCLSRFEAIKNERYQVPEGCRRYTLETFPGEELKARVVSELTEAGKSVNQGDNMADAFEKIRSNLISSLKRHCN